MNASARSILTTGLAGAAVAAILNLAVFAIAKAAGTSFVFIQNDSSTEIGYGLVALVSVGSILLGTALAALLGARRLRAVQILGAVIAVLSAGAPLATLDGPASGRAVLATLHLLTGVVFVAALEVARRRSLAGTASIRG